MSKEYMGLHRPDRFTTTTSPLPWWFFGRDIRRMKKIREEMDRRAKAQAVQDRAEHNRG